MGPNWVTGLYLELAQDHSGLLSDLSNPFWDHLPLFHLAFQQPTSLGKGQPHGWQRGRTNLAWRAMLPACGLTAGWHGGRGV